MARTETDIEASDTVHICAPASPDGRGEMDRTSPTLTHLALHVLDLDACVAFYRDYCAMTVAHERSDGDGGSRVVWLAEAGREEDFVFVLIAGGPGRTRGPQDFSHFGFALASRADIDTIARKAEEAGLLAWPPRQEAYPVGYYCGVQDPDGNIVEFSHGQPLGPGAEAASKDSREEETP